MTFWYFATLFSTTFRCRITLFNRNDQTNHQKNGQKEGVTPYYKGSYTQFIYNQHVVITPQQQPVRRLTGTEYQHFTANLGNIWETL